MKPTIGRVVHYTSLGSADGEFPSEQHAALITRVVDLGPYDMTHRDLSTDDETRYGVNLVVFYRTGAFYMVEQYVPFSPEYKRGAWTWPPR